MTDLEKAQHAASVFADYEFGGVGVWIIEETQTNYQIFGQPSSPIDLNRISHNNKQKYVVSVVGGIIYRYTAQEAYLIARSLERGD